MYVFTWDGFRNLMEIVGAAVLRAPSPNYPLLIIALTDYFFGAQEAASVQENPWSPV